MSRRVFRTEEERKEAKRVYMRAYIKSAAGKKVREAYYKSPEGRAAKKRGDKKYRQTKKGKESEKRGREKYYKTEKGQASAKRSREKYQKTKKYKIAHRRFVLKNDYKYQRRWKKSEKGKASNNASKMRWIKNNPIARLIATQRTRLSNTLKVKGVRKKLKTLDYIGCTATELKKHLEGMFQEGMTWNNYGKNGWEVDHIIPLHSFDLKTEEGKKKALHYSNLQPLWREDNLRKAGKY